MNPSILLTTLNARYSHASLALRCLKANLRELADGCMIREFVIGTSPQSIAEQILEHTPRIIGIGVYIWNATESAELIEILKKVASDTRIVLGGPEAGHLPHRVDFSAADYIIQGEGEIAFYELCRDLLSGVVREDRMIAAPMADITALKLPYDLYDDHDIAHRFIYVESSRGCPFECEFCLSAIDEKVRYFPLEPLLEAFETLWQRGARTFKFIDRTFNLNLRFANALMDFFLAKEPPYFVHFEVIPDHFPESLRERLKRFPPGSLQLEVGIQTLDPEIADRINRPLKLDKIRRNIAFLEQETSAHLHLDLIVGLPGESLQQFGANLDMLCALSRSEIQVGILKHLSGTTLSRHDALHSMVYSDTPPYDVLKTDAVSFADLQRMKRFARFWDLTYNSGNFNHSVRLLWPDGKVFDAFLAFSDWVYGRTASTWKIALERMAALLFEYLVEVRRCDPETVRDAMCSDLGSTGGRKLPSFLNPQTAPAKTPKQTNTRLTRRQERHGS